MDLFTPLIDMNVFTFYLNSSIIYQVYKLEFYYLYYTSQIP